MPAVPRRLQVNWRFVSMKVVARISDDVTGHMTSQLVLLRWPSSTQYSARSCEVEGTACSLCDDRQWTFAVCQYYSTLAVSCVCLAVLWKQSVFSVWNPDFWWYISRRWETYQGSERKTPACVCLLSEDRIVNVSVGDGGHWYYIFYVNHILYFHPAIYVWCALRYGTVIWMCGHSIENW